MKDQVSRPPDPGLNGKEEQEGSALIHVDLDCLVRILTFIGCSTLPCTSQTFYEASRAADVLVGGAYFRLSAADVESIACEMKLEDPRNSRQLWAASGTRLLKSAEAHLAARPCIAHMTWCNTLVDSKTLFSGQNILSPLELGTLLSSEGLSTACSSLRLECCAAPELTVAAVMFARWESLRSLELVECRMGSDFWAPLKGLSSLFRFTFCGSGTTQLVPPDEWPFGCSLRELSIAPLTVAVPVGCWRALLRSCPRLRALNIHAMDTRDIVRQLAEQAALMPCRAMDLRLLGLSPQTEDGKALMDNRTLQYKGLLCDEDIMTIVAALGHCLEALLLSGQHALSPGSLKALGDCAPLKVLGLRQCSGLASPDSSGFSLDWFTNDVEIVEVPDPGWLSALAPESSPERTTCSPSVSEKVPRFFFHGPRDMSAKAVRRCNIEYGNCLKVQPGVQLLDATSGKLEWSRLVNTADKLGAHSVDASQAAVQGLGNGTPLGIRQQQMQRTRNGDSGKEDIRRLHAWCSGQRAQDSMLQFALTPAAAQGFGR